MKKRKILMPIIIIIVSILSIGLFYYYNSEDKKTTLTLSEKTWIESNRNKLIDIGLLNDVAILNTDGEGVIFDFFNQLEKDTDLEFNRVSYSVEETIDDDYKFYRTNKKDENDILVYQDNYVLVGTKNEKYNTLNEIKSGVIGVLESDLKESNTYLYNTDNSFKTYKTIKDLMAAISSEEPEVKYIVLPKLILLNQMRENNKLYINYNITEMEDNYVIGLGKSKTLNKILEKYYSKWNNEKFEEIFASQFTNKYFELFEVDEKDKVKFRSKRYVYGFLENPPYDMEVSNRLVGMNNSLIKEFSDLTNVEISYKSYPTLKKLYEAFNTNKIDFYFDVYSKKVFDIEAFETASIMNEELVVLSTNKTNLTINSIKSLKDHKIITLADSKIEEQLVSEGVSVEKYCDVNTLLNKINDNSIVVLDKIVYDFYKNNKLKDFNIDYTYSLDDSYSYVIRDVKNNEVFEKFINYYLLFVNEKQYLNAGFINSVNSSSNNNILKTIMLCIALLIVLLVLFFIGNLLKPNKPKKVKLNIKKEDKVKYIDMLTSLKNRNYLNERIEIWDESIIYPQSLIVIDLNNIAYINDNYGHQEGDEVIKQAAGILISNQLPNSDIIRTNGNEFLIYMVEYDEKKIVSYIKKLNKELKGLTHGFGAAIGYSLITDGIKTIDDAVNEATLDMRNNKEETNK